MQHKTVLNPCRKKDFFDWHAALFPTGRSGTYKINVADWRTDSTGLMQVVSGALGKERVHFPAPNSIIKTKEMQNFIGWFNEFKI